MKKTSVTVKVLGTAQDGGVPHPNCYCNNCQLAKKDAGIRRLASSLAVILPDLKKWYLVDATPDMREQMISLNESYPYLRLMDGVVLSHAHIGHYTGLMFLGKEVISSKRLPVYAGKEMEEFLAVHAPWKQLVDLENIQLETIIPNQGFKLDESVEIVSLDVPHRNEYAKTFGFIIAGREKKLLYIPDIDRWEDWNISIEEVAESVDYCLLDGSFYSEAELTAIGRDYRYIPHPLMSKTMELLSNVARKGKTKIYFTHLNHTNPTVDPDHEIKKMIERNGFYIADDGMEFELS